MATGVDRIVEQLGGSPEKNKTGVDKILEILENGGGGGSSLPSYDSGDAGKVLTVADSGTAVEWAEGGGGDSAFYVHLTIANDDPLTYAADKTFAEILAAYNAGKVIIFVDEIEYNGFAIASYIYDPEGSSFCASGAFMVTGETTTVEAWRGEVTADDVFYGSSLSV